MSVFDIFTKATPTPTTPEATPAPTATPVPAATPVAPVIPAAGNIPTPTVPVDPNAPGIVPGQVATAEPDVDPNTPKGPLDDFKTLWDTAPIDPNAPPNTPPAALTAEEVNKVVAKGNFVDTITPEQMKAINDGGEEATKAMNLLLNQVAQKTMAQSILVNNKLIETAVERANKQHAEALPELLRKNAAADHLKTTNPLFSNPAIKPVAKAVHDQLLLKHPNATNAEIATMTQDFILAMGEEFAPKPATTDLETGETNWEAFLEGPKLG